MRHLLLIEDNPADVLMVREALRTCSVDADVLIAYDGEQAIHFFDELKFEPDLVVLDINVPKLNGLEILERYRNELGAPVLVLSNSINPADKRRAFELGVKEYLVKPINYVNFIQTVRAAIERWINRNPGQSHLVPAI